ncbi:MAG: homoserine dehydrogenase [Chloroflexi bacterium]|nr:homoserine dehydrogenase [Chloroflexota bacterium]
MSKEDSIGVGLLGLGVVGSSVAQALICKAQSIASLVGCPIPIRKALVRDLNKPRQFEVPMELLTDQPQEVLQDPAIAVVVEMMGGEHPALDYIIAALKGGKHVVTANKEVMAKHGPELLGLAAQRGVSLLFEASVGAGIPIIGPLLKELAANDITGIHAIINGTTNYILTRMSREGLDFQAALKDAQALGYAEPDPTNDVEGHDAAYKLAILSILAFRTKVHVSDVYREGISRLTARDFRYAAELGYAIKLMAIAQRDKDGVQVRVHPTMVPQEHLLGKVDGVFNAVEMEGDLVGRVVFHGRGAGAQPTTSAVVADVLEIARNIGAGGRPLQPPQLDGHVAIKPMADLETQYYLRLEVLDRAGVLAQIARVLGDLNVSIASVIQKDSSRPAGTADLVITTYTTREAAMQEALVRMARLEVVKSVCNFVRVEHLIS